MSNGNVYPITDDILKAGLHEEETDHILSGSECWCCPRIEYVNGVRVIVHNSINEAH